MMSLAALIEKYLDKILSVAFPYVVIHPWEQGVRTRAGKVTKHLLPTNGWFGSGIHTYWPLFGTATGWECNVEVFKTSPQTIGDLTVSFLVQARIRRLDLWFVNVNDPLVDVVGDTVTAVASELILALPKGAMPGPDFSEKVRKAAQARIRGWGADIMRVSFENVARVPALRLIGAEQAPLFGGNS